MLPRGRERQGRRDCRADRLPASSASLLDKRASATARLADRSACWSQQRVAAPDSASPRPTSRPRRRVTAEVPARRRRRSLHFQLAASGSLAGPGAFSNSDLPTAVLELARQSWSTASRARRMKSLEGPDHEGSKGSGSSAMTGAGMSSSRSDRHGQRPDERPRRPDDRGLRADRQLGHGLVNAYLVAHRRPDPACP